ncbi:MAG: T9SS type A sorting domain-containing protein [Melioribacteraceae bacterium]|nr:T9SS type A sorting domain-containing protein [Melioribacteraceae bacterium]
MKSILLLLTLSTVLVAQTTYLDFFVSAPFSGYVTSFTTGTPTEGLSYTAINGDFEWSANEVICYGTSSSSVIISSRDGKVFDFNSIQINTIYGGSISIVGSGYESFTINITGGTSNLIYSPGKLVTQVTISSTDSVPFIIYFDNVFTTLGYSLVTFTDGKSFSQSIIPNSTNQVVGRFSLDADYDGAELTSATINFDGSPTGISNFKLWASSDANFGGDSQLGSTVANYPGNGSSITFNGFSNSISASGTYYFLTADIANGASGTARGYLLNNSSVVLSDDGIFNSTINNSYLSDNATPLPVELTSFTADLNENNVDLNWQTATEINNYGFEIQRSVVSVQRSEEGWEKVGFVEGSGNSNSPKEYSFVDESAQNGKYSYRLKQIDFDGQFEYSDEIEVEVNNLPTEFSLLQNYPNPFNPTTTIKYSLPVDSKVLMEVYNILGEKVMTLINQEVKAGYNEVIFNANNLSSGIYTYTISTGEFNQVKKMMLLK